MKGDFTRLTFQPEKHYTSVRMQQGRLQLDSDWNEQTDIQNYLYRVQVKDLIGEANGVPTSEGSATQPYRDSFKLGVTPEVEGENNQPENDLTLAPGRLYANGTLCQLEGTLFEFQVDSQSASNRVKVTTLIVDGRILAENQWVEVYADENDNELASEYKQLLQIKTIDLNGLTLTLSDTVQQRKGKMRRRLTYKTQFNYPAPELPQDGLYLAYLDVWQRHVTAIDDPHIREVALTNIPDTTTRTQTVWQLKLQKLDETVIQPLVEELWDTIQTLLSGMVIHADNSSVQKRINEAGQTILQDVTQLNTVKAGLQQDLKKLLQADLRRRFRRLITTKPRYQLNRLLKSFNVSSADRKELQKLFRKLLNQKSPTEDNKQALRAKFEQPSNGTADRTAEQIEAFKTFLDNVTDNDSARWRSNQRSQFRELLDERLKLPAGQAVDSTWKSKLNELLASVPKVRSAQDKLRQEFNQLTAFEQQLVQIERLMAVSQSGALESGENADNQLSIQTVWNKYIASQGNRRALMNARAKLGAENGAGYRQVENHLYRVEIHNPGLVGDQTNGAASAPRATFKWSRDNGSVVSAIDKIQGNIITIRKSSQDAWADSKPGQYVEITCEEWELKGKPGVMVPLIRAYDTRLEFNASRIVGGSIPAHPTKVRRWDQQTDEATLLTRSADWTNLENGIQVQFSQNAEYQTGDYWLLPARAATNDIEWMTDQAKENPKNLPQPPLGIHHDYCLLAAVQVKDGKFPSLKPKQENQAENQGEDQTEDDESEGLKDYRTIFPPLVRCLDTAGGTVQGDLYINGRVGIKTDQPQTDLDVRGKITTQDLDVTGEFAAELFRGKTFQIAEKPTDADFTVYGTIQAGNENSPNHIVFNAIQEDTHFVFTGGRLGINTTDDPTADLEVTGTAKLHSLAIGADTPLPSAGELRTNSNVLLAATSGSVTVGEVAQPNQKLHVKGSTLIETASGSVILGLLSSPDPAFTSAFNISSGVRSAQAGFRNNNTWVMRTNGGDRLAIELDSGRIGIGTAPSMAMLEVGGTVRATRFEGDGSGLTGVVTFGGNNTFTGENTFSGNTNFTGSTTFSENTTFTSELTVNDEFTAQDRTILATNVNSNVGIGTTTPVSKLTINNNAAIGQNYARSNSIIAPENGLLVEGDVGIGTFDPVGGQPRAALAAKLEVQGATNDASQGALNITNGNHQSILYVRNDGRVGIGTTQPNRRLDVNGAIECNRVFIADSGSFGKDGNDNLFLQDSNVQVERNLFVQQRVVATAIEAGTITQTSSRALKEQIDHLSSQEVTQILQALNPVKFNFQADETRTTHAGFIAEETPDLLTSADKQSIKIVDIVAVLTKALQDQQQQATDLTTIIENQQNELHLLHEKVRQLEEQNVIHSEFRDSTARSMQSLSSVSNISNISSISSTSSDQFIDHPISSPPLIQRGRRRSSRTGWKRIFRSLLRWLRGASR